MSGHTFVWWVQRTIKAPFWLATLNHTFIKISVILMSDVLSNNKLYTQLIYILHTNVLKGFIVFLCCCQYTNNKHIQWTILSIRTLPIFPMLYISYKITSFRCIWINRTLLKICVQLYYYILHVTFKCCFIYYHVICNGEH